MPPKKRKSVETDSDSGSDYMNPSKSTRRLSAAKASTSAPPSKKRASSSNTKANNSKADAAPEIAKYIAKVVTAEYTEVQTRPCQSYDRFKSLPEKCISCIEKQSIVGGCRFVNLRAFKKRDNGNIDYADFAFRSNLELPESAVNKAKEGVHRTEGKVANNEKKKAGGRKKRKKKKGEETMETAPLRKKAASRVPKPETSGTSRSMGSVEEEELSVIVLDGGSSAASVIVLEGSPPPAIEDEAESSNAAVLAAEPVTEELKVEISVAPAGIETIADEVKAEAGVQKAEVTIEESHAEVNGASGAEAISVELKVANGTSTATEELRPEVNDTSTVEATIKQLNPLANEATAEELKAEAEYVLPLIAPTFAEQLRRELHHESTHLGHSTEGEALVGGARPLIRILSIPETRSLCDNCTTSIYMGSYICGCCGGELCLGCWEEWVPSEIRVNKRFRRIDTCSRRRRHIRDSMLFVTRAADGEISKLLERVEKYIPSAEKQIQETGDANLDIESIPTEQPTWPDDTLKYLATPKTPYSTITQQQFQSLWRRGGIPLVLTGFLDRFKLPWDPAYFILHHGKEPCYVFDCNNGDVIELFVADFFTDFENPPPTASYKLKDWPPSADFATTFPKLFEDFENALPFPSYTARKGALNLAAHFPEGYNAPDLGPKMYNAYPAPDFLPNLSTKKEQPRPVKGTTNLHLDLTDAMNIMLFSGGGENAPASATTSKAIPSCGAIWDIFPPSASTHLRAYLNNDSYLSAHKHEGAEYQDDPIHRQLYYLSEEDLATLYKDHGVMSHRIYQQPGDAVFIPAGCAHQVRNRKSCVKVAVDFLTPENVRVCKGLVEEGRGMGDEWRGRKFAGKEDVLQLWSCLGFAWVFFERYTAGEGKGKGKEEEGSHEKGYNQPGDTVMEDVDVDTGLTSTRTEIDVVES